jgi:hypothetical protein
MYLPSFLAWSLAVSGAFASPAVNNGYERRRFIIGNGNSFEIFGNSTYDYAIVGDGAAGNAIPLHLLDDPKTGVGFIETGSFMRLKTEIEA